MIRRRTKMHSVLLSLCFWHLLRNTPPLLDPALLSHFVYVFCPLRPLILSLSIFWYFSLITSVGLWPVSSSAPSPHPPSHQPNSRSLSSSHLIMRLVSKLVASLRSHGRQLPSEVGHMVRWVSGAGSSRARDSQRQQAAFSTLHFVNTCQQGNHEGPWEN